ncbi:MAG TPA: nucleotidyltransferase family protein [Terriglobales bacterium]
MAAAAQIEISGREGVAEQFELLCACCRPGSDGAAEEMIRRHVDWAGLLELAARHRVLPAVCERVGNCFGAPPEARGMVRTRLADHQRRVLRFTAALAGILEEFEKQRISLMPLKGPMLSQMLYGDSAAREFGDLDLLILPHDLARARVALDKLGYTPKIQLSGRCEREYLRSGYELVFGSGAEKNLVELHWQVLPRFYSVPFQVETLFERSVEMDFEGWPVRVPGKEDLLLMLCVHAAKHEWSHLGMVRDIARLAGCDLHWDLIAADARRMGVMRIVGISLFLARDLLGTKLPVAFPGFSHENTCDAFVSEFRRSLRARQHSDVESLRYFVFMMRLREKWRDRVRFAYRLASTPSLEEWDAVALPHRLFPLYRGVRAWRLVKRFARMFVQPSLAKVSGVN